MTEHIQVMSTAASEEEAGRIVEALLEARLAACVQVVGPMRSRYWWEGRLESADEWLLIAKTRASLFDRVADAIQATHSYDVPEITAIPVVAGSPDYLSWIDRETVSAADESS